MNFNIWRKNTNSFSRYKDFSVFVKSTHFKTYDVIISIATKWKLHFAYFFWILSPTKMKLSKILLCFLTNISNMFLALCWRLETSSRPCYYFIEIAIGEDLAIFNSWHLPFFIIPYSSFQKQWNTGILTSLVTEQFEQVAILKRTRNLAPVLKIVQKISKNHCPCLYLSIDQVWCFEKLWFKRYS